MKGTTADAPLDYGSSQVQVAQLGADIMHQQGYHGEGMLIGVLDAGFQNADKVSFLKPIFDEKRVLATYDFVKKETSVYEDDSHGLSCLSAITATADKTYTERPIKRRLFCFVRKMPEPKNR